jgi:survival-of-motor-neuron-related-splicing factor 30
LKRKSEKRACQAEQGDQTKREMSSLEELEAKVREYEQNMNLLEEALKQDPENELLQQAKADLSQILTLARTVFEDKQEETLQNKNKRKKPEALAESSNGWRVGDKCEAKWTEDSVWYKATILKIFKEGNSEKATVSFDEYGNQDTVNIVDSVRNLTAVAVPISLKAKKIIADIPESLKIQPSDDDETRAIKKRKLKTLKSKNRFQRIENEQSDKINSWKKFQKKNSQVYSKDSMFSTPDGGKVGVVGSGKAMTEAQQSLRVKPAKTVPIPPI